jgi:hypothetical protein
MIQRAGVIILIQALGDTVTWFSFRKRTSEVLLQNT